MSGSSYLYPNDLPEARRRLHDLEAIEDAGTIAALDRLGDLSGRACLEIGAGAGSIARWISGRLGPGGSLVVTDLDTQHVAHLASGQVRVLRHDIAGEPLPERAFDVIHVRHVLFHLGERLDRAIDSICRALRPGGVLVCEESDFSAACAAPDCPDAVRSAYDRGLQAMLALYRVRGLDPALGARLPDVLAERRLRVEHRSSDSRRVRGGTREARFHRQSYAQLAPRLVETGLASEAECRAMLAAFENAALEYLSRATVRVTARAD